MPDVFDVKPAGDRVYFTEAQRDALGDLAETARAWLNSCPTRAEFDAFQAKFLNIEPSFYPIRPDMPEGKLSKRTILSQYQDAHRRLTPEAF